MLLDLKDFDFDKLMLGPKPANSKGPTELADGEHTSVSVTYNDVNTKPVIRFDAKVISEVQNSTFGDVSKIILEVLPEDVDAVKTFSLGVIKKVAKLCGLTPESVYPNSLVNDYDFMTLGFKPYPKDTAQIVCRVDGIRTSKDDMKRKFLVNDEVSIKAHLSIYFVKNDDGAMRAGISLQKMAIDKYAIIKQ
jgi:hypothetical protein